MSYIRPFTCISSYFEYLVHCGGLLDRSVLEMRSGRGRLATILEHLENLGTTETRPSQTLEEQILRWRKVLCLSMGRTSPTILGCLWRQCQHCGMMINPIWTKGLIRPLSRPSDNSLETFTPNVCLLSDRLGWKTEVIRVESVSIIHCLDQDDPSSRGHYHS